MMRRLQQVSVLVMMLIVAGCGSDTTSTTDNPPPSSTTALQESKNDQCQAEADNSGFYDPQNYEIAYNCAVDTITWPSAYKPDSDLVSTTIRLNPYWEETIYPPGIELVDITGSLAICAWALELLDATNAGSAERQDAAIQHLSMYAVNPVDNVPGFPADGFHASTTDHFRELISQAEVGDTSPLANRIAGSCDLIPWPSTETGP